LKIIAVVFVYLLMHELYPFPLFAILVVIQVD